MDERLIIPALQMRTLSKNGQVTSPKVALQVRGEAGFELYAKEELASLYAVYLVHP